jgi:proton glutamate symport protein
MKRISLMTWVILATVLGLALGAFAPGFAVQLQFVSNIFLRLIKSIIAPLIFASLVYGIAKSGSIGAMRRIGLKAMTYFTGATLMALVVGLSMVNIFRPGDGIMLKAGASPASLTTAHLKFADTVERIFPKNIIESMGNGDVLQVVIFSVLFGIACTAVGRKSELVVQWCEAVMKVMFKYTQYVTYLTPFGAGAAMAATVGKNGLACPSHEEWCGRLGDSSRAVDRWEGAWECIGVAVRAHFSQVHVRDAEIIKERCRRGGD